MSLSRKVRLKLVITSTTASISPLSSKARLCCLLPPLARWPATTYRTCCCLMQPNFSPHFLILATPANLFLGRWWTLQLNRSKELKSSMTLSRVFRRLRSGSSAGSRTLRTKCGWTTFSGTRSRTLVCSSSSGTRCRSILRELSRTRERTDWLY